MSSRWILLGSLALFLAAVSTEAAAGDLDGTAWKMRVSGWWGIVMFWKSDTLGFDGGKFESAESVPYGFKPGPYNSKKIEGDISWSATQMNDKGEKMEWQGTMSESRALGTYIWTKPNGKTVTVSWKAKKQS